MHRYRSPAAREGPQTTASTVRYHVHLESFAHTTYNIQCNLRMQILQRCNLQLWGVRFPVFMFLPPTRVHTKHTKSSLHHQNTARVMCLVAGTFTWVRLMSREVTTGYACRYINILPAYIRYGLRSYYSYHYYSIRIVTRLFDAGPSPLQLRTAARDDRPPSTTPTSASVSKYI